MARGPRKRKVAEAGHTSTETTVTQARPSDVVSVNEQPRKKRSKRGRIVLDSESTTLSAADGARILASWSDSTAQMERWLTSRGGGVGENMIERAGSVTRLRDYFPSRIADAVLAILEGLPEEVWELSEQAGDSEAAQHRFWSVDVTDVPELATLRSMFWRLLPSFRGEPTLPIFSCGRYASSNFIGRHDDRAHVPFFGDDNIYSRTVAGIWHLTREWSDQDGGHLVDLELPADSAERNLVPIYNSLVLFEVPHMHSVSPVLADRYRYSIFGWWHQKGKRYALPGEGDAPPAAITGNPVVKTRKKKKKQNKAGEVQGASKQ